MQLSVLSPHFLDTLREPKAQTLPLGESRVMVSMLHPSQQRKPTPSSPCVHERAYFHCCSCWRGMWLRESTCPQFMKLFVGTFIRCDLLKIPFLLFIADRNRDTRKCRKTPNGHKPPAPWTATQRCHILFKYCYITMGDGHTASLLQT